MNKEEIEIITLGDIFRNLETEEQAFEFLKYIKNLQQENKQLKDNWNELKEYTQEKYDNPSWASCGARYVLEKMQELEQGKDE